jgi:hypothetical protein
MFVNNMKKQQGFVPIILIMGVIVLLVFGVGLVLMLRGDLNIFPDVQKVLKDGVDYRQLNCRDIDLTGCDDDIEGDNPEFVD